MDIEEEIIRFKKFDTHLWPNGNSVTHGWQNKDRQDVINKITYKSNFIYYIANLYKKNVVRN